MKILTLDIETKPALVYTWGLFDQNIGLNQVVDPGGMICVGVKWHDLKKPFVISETDFKERTDFVGAVAELLNDADVVVTYNGKSFDEKHIRADILRHGVEVPSPWISVDLYSVVRRNFKFLSNKLQHVSEQLQIGSKLQHNGFDLWRGWMDGDEASIRRMLRYCKQDVVLTEKLFDELRPWINLPNPGLVAAQIGDKVGEVCPHCGSTSLRKAGLKYTVVSAYQRYQCNADGCRRYSTATTRIASATMKGI